jgi:uncharacterized protein (TIGR01777 family)
MKILLTGATGLIGKEVGKALVLAGHEVIAVTRSESKAKLILPFPAKILEWKSVTDDFPLEKLKNLTEHVDGVIHLMGENIADHRWSDLVKEKLYQSRVVSTQKIQAAVQSLTSSNSPISFWIQGSATGYYGATEALTNENSPAGTGYLAELTLAWESALPPFTSDTRVVVMRTGVVMSHQGGAFLKILTPFKNNVGGALGDGQQWMSLVHLQDVVRFIVHAVQNHVVKGIFNLVAPEPIQNSEFTKLMASTLGVSVGPRVPKVALQLLLGQMSEAILGSQQITTIRMADIGFQFLYPHTTAILNECITWFRDPINPESVASVFYAEQWVAAPIEDIFQFFSDAKNLETLTPDFLNFSIVSVSTPQVEQGTLINYLLKLHGIPIKWKTEILAWEPGKRFVDNQLQGPYALWYHEHRFMKLGSGTLIQDFVRYRVPFGMVGALAGGAYIRHDVQKIFNYRREKIDQLFPNC